MFFFLATTASPLQMCYHTIKMQIFIVLFLAFLSCTSSHIYNHFWIIIQSSQFIRHLFVIFGVQTKTPSYHLLQSLPVSPTRDATTGLP